MNESRYSIVYPRINIELNTMTMKKELYTPHQKYMTRLTDTFERLILDRQEIKGTSQSATLEHKNDKRIVLEEIRIASDPEMYRKIEVLKDVTVEKKK